MSHQQAYLGLGSNMGDRMANLQSAIEHLADGKELVVAAQSGVYETEPQEYAAQDWFLNMAVAVDTTLTPRQLLDRLQNVEHLLGRQRLVAKGPRTIDIDILLFGQEIVDVEDLTIPHPAMHQRRFVLTPLSEIAGSVRHPVLGQTIYELLTVLEGQAVRRLTGEA